MVERTSFTKISHSGSGLATYGVKRVVSKSLVAKLLRLYDFLALINELANCGDLSRTIKEGDASAEFPSALPFEPARTILTSRMSSPSREGRSDFKIAKDRLCKLEELYNGINPVINTSLLLFGMTRDARTAGSRSGAEGGRGNRLAING